MEAKYRILQGRWAAGGAWRNWGFVTSSRMAAVCICITTWMSCRMSYTRSKIGSVRCRTGSTGQMLPLRAQGYMPSVTRGIPARAGGSRLRSG